jgi:hypothetical protein
MRKAGLPERYRVGNDWLTTYEIGQRYGFHAVTVYWRIKRGWPMDEVIGRPVRGGWVTRRGRGLTLNGKPVTQRQLAEMAGVSEPLMSRRLNKLGMTPEQAVKAGNFRTGNY